MTIDDMQQEREINPVRLTTKNGQITGIKSSERKQMASDAEVKFYLERKKMLEKILESNKEYQHYMILLDYNKNGAD